MAYIYTCTCMKILNLEKFKHLLNDSLSLKHFEIIFWAVIDIFNKLQCKIAPIHYFARILVIPHLR